MSFRFGVRDVSNAARRLGRITTNIAPPRAKLSALAIGGIVFAAAAASITPRGPIATLRATSTDNAYVQGDITPISPKISGYVADVAIIDNQAVTAGDILFRIDDRDYRARVAQAAAAVDQRRAALGNLAGQIELQRAVIEQTVFALAAADAEAARAGRDFDRARDLVEYGGVSRSDHDRAEAEHFQSRAYVEEAKANIAAAERRLHVLETQKPQIDAEIAAAQSALRLAVIELENTVIRSPANGWVSERRARPGQYVRPGSLLTALVAKDFWIVANFKETQIADARIGDRVSIKVDGAPGVKFTGRIESVSPASGAQFALLPPDNATGNFTRIVQRIPVKVTLDADQPALDRLRPGMSARVVVLSRARNNGYDAISIATAPLEGD